MSKLPPIAVKPYCCKHSCPNPGTQVEVVTGIGTDPMTREPIRRARVYCKWHGGHYMSIGDYRELCAAQRVQEALLERTRAKRINFYINEVQFLPKNCSAEEIKAEYERVLEVAAKARFDCDKKGR